MKKRICTMLLLTLAALLFICACGKDAVSKAEPTETDGSVPTAGPDDADGSAPAEGGKDILPESKGELSLLYHMQRQYAESFTENGYYYLTLEAERLSDGREAWHLMYMDFAARQEIYLCSDASCSHNTADCTSVFPTDEFGFSTALFVMNDSLFILSKEQDHDGSAVMGVLGDGSGAAVEVEPTVLYRANLDGTGREKLYTFDPSVTVEDIAAGDGDGLFFITKKVTTEVGEGFTYQTSAERKLVYLDLAQKKETALFSMNFGDNIDWDIIGCSGRRLILYGIDFGRELSEEEKHSEESSKYEGSSGVFATVDVDSGTRHEIYRKKKLLYEVEVDKNKLYLGKDGEIISVDLNTGASSTLCTVPDTQLWGIIDGRLYTRSDKDKTLYFIDTETGDISHCGLVDRSTGSSLDIVAPAGEFVLVIYDSDVTPRKDGSFTVHGYRYALIEKDDLFSGRDNFAPIKMTGSGR